MRGIPIKPFPAKWDDLEAPGAVIRVNSWGKKYNAKAGIDRNAEMIEEADAVALFPGGKGTRDTHRRAIARGLDVYLFDKV